MKLSELSRILESLNTVLPFKKLHSDAEKDMYVFEYNHIKFVVDFENLTEFAPMRVKSVTFYEAIPDNIQFNKTHKHISKNTGPLFRTVAEVVTSTATDWDVICFTGEQSRVGLYSALGKKFSGSMNVYTFLAPIGALWVISKEPLNKDQAAEISKFAATSIGHKV